MSQLAMLRKSVTGKDQSDGAQTFDISAQPHLYRHQLQFEPSATPSAGTGIIAIKTPGATAYTDIGTMDLTDTDDYILQFEAAADAIKFTPALFDAAKTYALYLLSGNEGRR